jgi:hypothetical protein
MTGEASQRNFVFSIFGLVDGTMPSLLQVLQLSTLCRYVF